VSCQARPNLHRRFLGNLSSSVSELLGSGQAATSTVYQPAISQEFRTLLEDKSIDISTLAFYKHKLYEYEHGTAPAVVKGRLRVHLSFWVLETIRSGYVIPFESTPSSICLPNNRSALDHSDFVSSAVCDLLKLGLISEVLTPPTVINPLSVSVN